MSEIEADFEISTNNLEAEYEITQSEHFDCSFEIFAAGATFSNIVGSPYDNEALASALNQKADNSTVEELSETVTNNYNTLDTKIDTHIADKTNPHEVTKAQIGLSNVDNTSDLNKPISTATQTALNGKQNTISDLSTIRSNASNGQSAYNTIQTYGDIVTYDASNFATSIQGQKADTALQPNDDITNLNNNAGYITAASLPTVNNSTITFQKNNVTVGDVNLNQPNNETINFNIPTTASDINALPDTTTINDLTTTAQQNAINSGANTTNIGQIATNTNAISTEVTDRQNADIALQNQIDAIVSSSDVFDIVGTYAELQAYDISTVPVNDIIKVLVDSTHNDAATYYRCVENGGVKSWSYIGSEGAYYTKGEADAAFVPQTRTINGYALSNNVSLTASDVGAISSITSSDVINALGYTPENINNKVTSLSSLSTDTQYPSAKLVYDELNDKQETLISGTNIKTVNNESLLGSGNIDTSVIPPIAYGTSTTAAATVQKEVSIPEITELKTGQVIVVQPTITSTVANSTIKLNNFDPYPMRYNNAAITTSTDSVVWSANYVSQFVFDGTYWQFAGHGLDSNTTYTLNYSVDAGAYKSGTGSYAISRYSLCMQKPDMTWEKVTATNANYSTGTSKSVNTNGFILGNIRYYNTTTNIANGANTGTNVMYEKAATLDLRYSTNCGDTPSWTAGDYIYFVGTMGADGLFYLDTTQWWTNTLPSTNDGKLYVQLGKFLSGSSISLYENHPAYYYDGTKLCEYKIANNKQDTISDLSTIRSNAANGQSAYTTIVGYGNIVTHNTSEFATSAQGALADTALQPNDNISLLNNNAGYITSSALTGYATENFVTSQGYITSSALSPYVLASSLATVATSGSYADLSNKPTIPTVGDGTITINQGGIQKGTFTVNQSGNATINLDAGGTVDQTFDGTSTNAQSGVAIETALTDGSLDLVLNESLTVGNANLFYDVNDDILSINGYSSMTIDAPITIAATVTLSTETDPETGDNILYITDDITSDTVTFSSQGGISVDTSTSGGEFTYNGSEVATLSDIPSIPTVNNATLTIQKNGTTVNTFTANASTDVTANITVPTDLGDLTNNAGYTKNVGTVTSVNNVSPVNGNVTLTIPAEGANKDLSNLTATGEAHFQAPISDLATIRSGASAGATAVQPSDITDVVRQQTASPITLYAWFHSGATPEIIYTLQSTITTGTNYNCYNSNGELIGVCEAGIASLIYNTVHYSRSSDNDVSLAIQTLTDNSSNALNITQADGQWISNWVQLASGVTYPKTNNITYSLASYLPNNNYIYDVLFGAKAVTGSTSGNQCNVALATDIQIDSVTVAGCRTRTSSTVHAYGAVRFPVGTNRNVTVVANSDMNGTFNLHVIGYRRLGTNL